MRKIHITEEQLNAIKKSIEEEYSVDATQKLSDNGNNAKTAAQELQAENPTLASDLKTGKATMTYNPTGLKEGEYKSFTKKQIKEARVKYLKENSVVFKKKYIK